MRKTICCILTITLFILFLIGLYVVGKPYLVQKEYDFNVQSDVSTFRELVRMEDREESADPAVSSDEALLVFPELRRFMEEYNQTIYETGQSELTDAWAYEEEILDPTAYGLESDVIAVVSIPALDLAHPLRIGANYANLDQGFAVMTQTSMPIGGQNTNCVIAGHRGWHHSQYLRDIEKLQIGDRIYIENPWETLEYEVCEIRIILPHESENIFIQDGRDLITLVTCHPYLVKTHRYLVYAERVLAAPEEPAFTQNTTIPETTVSALPEAPVLESSEQAIWLDLYAPWLCVAFIFLLFLFCFIRTIHIIREG